MNGLYNLATYNGAPEHDMWVNFYYYYENTNTPDVFDATTITLY